jgi:hypothetical protein
LVSSILCNRGATLPCPEQREPESRWRTHRTHGRAHTPQQHPSAWTSWHLCGEHGPHGNPKQPQQRLGDQGVRGCLHADADVLLYVEWSCFTRRRVQQTRLAVLLLPRRRARMHLWSARCQFVLLQARRNVVVPSAQFAALGAGSRRRNCRHHTSNVQYTRLR